jgi:raffinose/stachyose/melibiose transport system permease protein
MNRPHMSRRHSVTNGILYFVLTCGAILVLFPVYMTLVTALKSFQMTSRDFFGLPTALYLDNFRAVFQDAKILYFIRNSMLITLVSVFFIIVFVPTVSYAISRRFRGLYFRVLYYLLVGGIFVPALVILVPLVKLTSWWGMQNPVGIIPIYVGLAFSSNTFIAVGYMKSIPVEIDESASLDGAGVFTILFRMIYPMAKPMVATIAILAVLWIWNDFQMPLVLLNQKQNYWTLPLFQFNFRNQYTINYNVTAAALTISMIPMIVVYLLMQRYIISGITAGAIKG